MFGIQDFATFVLAGLLLNLTPGADTLFVVTRTAAYGLRVGMVAALGIGTGCLVHIASAALGVSALLFASATAFTLVKWIGAAYLVYLGIDLLRARASKSLATTESAPIAVDLGTVFRQGFLTNALNPKVAMFFLAFLPQFISADAGQPGIAMAILGIVFDVNGTLYLLLVAWLTARAASRITLARTLGVWLQRIVGGLFVLLGVRLLVTHPA